MKKVCFLMLFVAVFNISAQEIKFGKVSKEELEEKFYPLDSSANAVVIFKERRTRYDYNDNIGWVLVTQVYEGIKIYNENGFEAATKKIRLYESSGEEESLNLKAFTYNLEAGKVEKTRLERGDIFDEIISDNWFSKNFTMPNVKDGSVIEWEYEIRSPFISNIDDVVCQYDIPIKELDIQINIPEFFEFKVTPNFYFPIHYTTTTGRKGLQTSTKTRTQNGGWGNTNTNVSYDQASVNENIYTAKHNNIPALKEEPFVGSMNNYRAQLNFELTAYRPLNGIPKFYNNTWEDVAKTIYDSEYFGGEMSKTNYFKEDLEGLKTQFSSNSNQLMVAIFEFVKHKIKWNGTYSKYTSRDGVKKAYQEGSGNVAEINLTLVSMLKEAGFKANPVLVSTREHGIPFFPTHEGFNYVIACVETASGVALFDATEEFSAPNVLPERDLNWQGRLVREDGTSTPIRLYPNSHSQMIVKLQSDLHTDGSISGILITNYNKQKGLNYREKYAVLSDSDLEKELKNRYNPIEIEQFKIRNLDKAYEDISEMVKFNAANQVDIINEKIYVSPLLFLSTKVNPFKQEERNYPIDYGSPWQNEYQVSIKLPVGYQVESVPEDLALGFGNDSGSMIMRTEVKDNTILVTYQAKMNSAIIGPEHYENLKAIYSSVISKQQEKIVLSPTAP